MKFPNDANPGEPNLTIPPVHYAAVVREDRALQRKSAATQNSAASEDPVDSGSKSKVRALSEVMFQIPEGAVREVLTESFTAIINGEGDIKQLRALTIRAARQLRTMYLSGGEKALAADIRWRVRELAHKFFGIQLSVSPRGLMLGEGNGAEHFNAFLKIESNGHVWAGETYEDAEGGPLTEPLTTEDVLQRLSEKLLRSIY